MAKGNLAQAYNRYVAQASPNTLNDLFREVTSYAQAVSRRKGVIEADAEEIAQDVAVKVWTTLGKYDPARSSLSTWVYRVTMDAVITRWRRRTYEGQLPGELPPEDEPRSNPHLMKMVRSNAGYNLELVESIAATGDLVGSAHQLNLSAKVAKQRLKRIGRKIKLTGAVRSSG